MLTSTSPGVIDRTPESCRDVSPVTMAQTLLAGFVMVFSGWLIDSGYAPCIALLIASGAAGAGSGLIFVPRTVSRLICALGQQKWC